VKQSDGKRGAAAQRLDAVKAFAGSGVGFGHRPQAYGPAVAIANVSKNYAVGSEANASAGEAGICPISRSAMRKFRNTQKPKKKSQRLNAREFPAPAAYPEKGSAPLRFDDSGAHIGRTTMKAFQIGLAVLALTACTPKPEAVVALPFNDPKDVQSITAIEEYIATQTDPSLVMKHYADDAVVADIFTPGVYKGKVGILAAFSAQMKSVQAMKHEIRGLNIASNGNFACAASTIRFDATTQDGKSMALTVRELDAFKKINGEWQIVQQHISLPVDMKTGTAVMNGDMAARGLIKWGETPFADSTTSEQAKKDLAQWLEIGTHVENAAQLMEYYDPEGDPVLYDIFYPGELRGRKEIGDFYEKSFTYSSVDMKFPTMIVDSDGSFGIHFSEQDMRLHNQDGSTQFISLRQSDCLRREGDKWVSFFEMLSVPVNPADGKAVMANPGAFK
jgi:ketosteroid isomerase-like protein